MAADDKRDRVTAFTAILAIVVSIVSLGFTLFWNSPIGEVQPIEPTEIAIVRGIRWNIEGTEGTERLATAPSDHIVMPLSWQNNSGSSVLIHAPRLVLRELSKAPEDGGVPTGDKHSLLLYGEYSEVSISVFSGIEAKPPDLRGSLVLEPHSATQNILMFRVMHWEGDNKDFRIKGDTHYRVSIEFEQIPTLETLGIPKGFHSSFLHIAGRDEKAKMLLSDWHTVQNVDCLQLYGDPVEPEDINRACKAHQGQKNKGETIPAGYGWDYRSLVPGARE